MRSEHQTKAIPAAGLILVSQSSRQSRVLLLKRSADQGVYPNAWVFPGGKVESEDGPLEHEISTARIAAVRETHEEAGIIVSESSLQPFCCWVTPPGQKKRFSTWFFLGITDQQYEVEVDQREIAEGSWFNLQEVTRMTEQGELFMPPATYVTLLHVQDYLDRLVDDEGQASEPFRALTFKPIRVDTTEGFVSVYQEDAAYVSGDLNAEGPRHRLISRNWHFEYIRSE